MKKLISVLIIVFSVQMSLYAQQLENSIVKGGGGYVFFGTSFINPSSLDKSLRQYDLPEFGSGQKNFTIGGGGGTFLNRMYFGGEGAGHFGLSASNELYRTKIYGGYGMVHIGYALLHQASTALYPTLGIGGGGSTMSINAGPSAPDNIDALLLPPGSRIHTGYMLLKLGLNSDFFVGSKVRTTGGLLLGVSAGYQLAPLVSQWKQKDESVPELEKFHPSGFYIRLKVGWAANMPDIISE